MQINVVPLTQNADGALHNLFTENVLVRNMAKTHDTIFLSLREIIIKVMSRCVTWQVATSVTNKVQGHNEMRDPLCIFV